MTYVSRARKARQPFLRRIPAACQWQLPVCSSGRNLPQSGYCSSRFPAPRTPRVHAALACPQPGPHGPHTQPSAPPQHLSTRSAAPPTADPPCPRRQWPPPRLPRGPSIGQPGLPLSGRAPPPTPAGLERRSFCARSCELPRRGGASSQLRLVSGAEPAGRGLPRERRRGRPSRARREPSAKAEAGPPSQPRILASRSARAPQPRRTARRPPSAPARAPAAGPGPRCRPPRLGRPPAPAPEEGGGPRECAPEPERAQSFEEAGCRSRPGKRPIQRPY
ncbi:Dynamin-3 [Manis pentadactyla]|nr:Dynamin-3 [Manis pentadactyla]